MADRIILARATDSNGDIVSGAKATFFEDGTSTPLTVYSDEAATTPVSPPLLADSEGVFAATFTTEPVKVIVTDTSDVNLPGFPSDPHPISQASGTGASAITFSPISGNAATDVQAAIKVVTDLWNAVTTYGKSIIAAADKAAARVVLGIGASSHTAGTILQSDGTDYTNFNPGTTGTSATALNSGTEADFTGIPAWASQIEVMLNSVSLNGTDDILVQIGDAGGFETTGYTSGGGTINGGTTGSADSSAGFYIRVNAAARAAKGVLILTKDPSTNDWFANGNFSLGSNVFSSCGGAKLLSDTLTQVRVTRSGTDTFDGVGTVSIRWRV